MAKKITGMIKLQIPAGKATPAPPVGPALDNTVLISWDSVKNSMQKLLIKQA